MKASRFQSEGQGLPLLGGSAPLRIPGVGKVGASSFTSPHCNHGNLTQAKGVYERDNSFPRAQNLVCKISRNLKGLGMMKRRLCSRNRTAASPSSVSLGQHSISLQFQPICHRMNELRRGLDLSSEPDLLTLTRERPPPLAAEPSLHTESRCAMLWTAP